MVENQQLSAWGMKESQLRTGKQNRVYNKPPTAEEQEKIVGLTTTEYWVENHRLLLRNKRYITTNSAKKREHRTYNYRYEGRGPNSAGDKKNYCRLLGNSFIYSTGKHKRQLKNANSGSNQKGKLNQDSS